MFYKSNNGCVACTKLYSRSPETRTKRRGKYAEKSTWTAIANEVQKELRRVENVETKHVEFYAPKTVTLVLKNAKLNNRKSGVKKIHDGANKEVVSWIMAEQVYVLKYPFSKYFPPARKFKI